MSATKKRGLGRGLDALLSTATPAKADIGQAAHGEPLREIALTHIQPGKHQPRRHFDEAALQELANSIKAQGVVQPIVLRPIGAEQYELVAGERRWRAAQIAGLENIPAVVRQMDDRSAMAVALVENIQRADLNPLEESSAMHRLIEEYGLTHEACAEAVGRKRATISNLLRLTELNEDVQENVRAGKLSLGHAKALLGLQGPRQSSLARLVVNKELSVRATEALVQAEGAPRIKPRPSLRPFGKLEGELSARLGLPVTIDHGRGGAGKISIGFKDIGELEKVVSMIR